jgi:mannose-6-phosphate isomerase-like protein (cupin superfamily)
MPAFDTMMLPEHAPVVAPDGTDVRPLLALSGGSMAHFSLVPGRTSVAVTHRTVEEIWFVLGGHGEMWRSQDGRDEIVRLHAGLCLTIPLGCRFQLRATGTEALTMAAITMPPWPGMDEAVAVEGVWTPSA